MAYSSEIPLNVLEVLESIPDSLLVAAEDGSIVFTNAQLEKLFGYRRDQIQGRPVEMLMPQRFQSGHVAFRRDYSADPYVRPMGDCSGFYGLHHDGHEFPVEIYLSPFSAQGTLFVMAAIRDISQRKRLEEALRRSHEQLEQRVRERTAALEEANRRLQQEMTVRQRAEEQVRQQLMELAHVSRLSVLGEMTSGIGHELNQPLAAINNYAQGCVRRLEAGAVDAGLLIDVIKRIATEATRASGVIERFRRFARREQLQREWVKADALLGEAVRLTEIDSEKHGVAVQLQMPDGLPRIFVDPLQIQQVIVNLVRNAIEATVDGSPGVAATPVLVQAGLPGGDVLEVAVIDGGHGLKLESAEAMFEPFSSTKPQGLGMGLSISRRIIEAHAGKLGARPNDGQGMTFSFVLPVQGTADGG